jgi:hypothetical protein
MVKKIENNKKEFYVCEACDFAYEDQATAKKCEDWCNEHHSCNMDIIQDGVDLKKE